MMTIILILLLFASTTKFAKSISYPAKPSLGCNFLTKSSRGVSISPPILGLERFPVYMHVCLYIHTLIITLEVAISIRLTPNLVHKYTYLKIGLCPKMDCVSFIETPREHPKKYNLATFGPTIIIFDLKVLLDGVHQDKIFVFGGNPLEFRKFMIFEIHFIEYHYFTFIGTLWG